MGDSIFIEIFVVGSENACVLKQSAEWPFKGPRSLILVPIDRAYATSYSSSILTLVVFCPVSEILQVFC